MIAQLTQGSPEWHQARLGKVTASRISDVAAKIKTGWGASRARYMGELIAENLTHEPTPSFSNAAMQHGTDTEPQAADAYSFYTDAELELVGFVDHPSIDQAGCSPDRLVSAAGKNGVENGLVEIKCNGKWLAPSASGATLLALIQGCHPQANYLSSAWSATRNASRN